MTEKITNLSLVVVEEAMANLFSEHGANVIVTGRDKNEAENIANQLAIDSKVRIKY